MLIAKIRKVHPGLGVTIPLPLQQTPGSAGFDMHAAIDRRWALYPGEPRIIPCGFAIEIPRGYEAQIRPRSGLASKHSVIIPNAPGTIDSDYRGEVCVCLLALGDPININPGDRIAQMIFSRVYAPDIMMVPELGSTDRGAGGFGSTGR